MGSRQETSYSPHRPAIVEEDLYEEEEDHNQDEEDEEEEEDLDRTEEFNKLKEMVQSRGTWNKEEEEEEERTIGRKLLFLIHKQSNH